MNSRKAYPAKRTMNLYYRPDRTTKPATISLYVLFVLVLLLALFKILVYDVWAEVRQARQTLAGVETQLQVATAQLADYDQVQARYRRYAATEEELATVDRMEILGLVESAVGASAEVQSISISGSTVQVEFSGVSLAQIGQIVSKLEASPLVQATRVNTAATTENDNALVQASVLIQLQGGALQ